MSTNKQKLELTWIGKHKRPRLEPRILLEDKSLSYHAEAPRAMVDDLFAEPGDLPQPHDDNLLIHGDNLLALKALEQQYAGKVKCVFIDPPYNTGSAFTHYDDGVEHSMWLSLMRDRLEVIRRLMSDDGSLWITIDDNEAHYLKVLCDEVFGRQNFISNVIWQKKFSPQNDARWLSDNHDHILVYAKQKDRWAPIQLPRTEQMDQRYKNPDNDPRGPWASTDITRAEHRDRDYWGMETPSGKVIFPAMGRSWSRPKENIEKLAADNRLWFGPKGDRMPRLKKFINEVKDGVTPMSVWLHNEVGHNQESKKEIVALFGRDVFSTPKPERLIERILHIATNPNDLVLDSFAGSGTTGAVAHKMGRRWIMVELGEHCKTHIVPRLKKVIDGEDQGGISKAVNWQGGGGFRYLRLAPSLLKRDSWGNWIINKEYNPEMLAEAMCKHMGFSYAPSRQHFWMHGHSTESDFIYVTTGSLSHDQLRKLSDEVGPERTLMICCKAFMAEGDFPNLTLKKIPQAVLKKCQWDHDDYSFTLNVLGDDEEEGWEHESLDDDNEE
ncbi:MAG: site-specific DNA-methyltransferase [Gammaproteobacteria bacterium]